MPTSSSSLPLRSRAVARNYFGTDGVRGIVGEFVTVDLLERLGKASALWSGRGRVFVGRDTRGSGEELEEAFARGVASAGGAAVLAGVVPTPAVALLRLDLGVVITASHNPPEYNGVKFFDNRGRKLSDAAEEEIEALLDAPQTGGGEIDHIDVAVDSYLEHVLERFGSDLGNLRIAVDCANGAYSGIAPRAFADLGADVEVIGNEPNGENINVGCGATDLAALQQTVTSGGFDLCVAFDGDGDRMLAVDENGAIVDGDQIVAILALHLGVDLVAVTTMTNLGFHRLMEERGVRVITTDVGDRYVLEALYREGGILGGEQSGHVICLRDHVTGDGLAAALLLCEALRGRTLSEVAGSMVRYPQAKQNLPRPGRGPLPHALIERIEDVNADLNGDGRVLVRPSGTEPVVRVLAEAQTEEDAEALCARIASLVMQELG
jgi:phosphoglucosamine mutase